MFRTTIIILAALLLPAFSFSQLQSDAALARRYPFINKELNRIQQASHLDSFFNKLSQLEKGGKSVISIVHIGDSHVQPGFTGQLLRQGFQQRYGNAGRGLVFPYQLAASNSPDDLRSSSSQSWQFNRVAHPEINIPYGVSGFGIVGNNTGVSEFRLQLRGNQATQNSFSRVRVFSSNNSNWTARVATSDTSLPFIDDEEHEFLHQLVLPDTVSDITISASDSTQAPVLYGMELRNDSSGILFHSIGVNGARADHYNQAENFWKQLPVLDAQLYIVSLGTNEAQARIFNEAAYVKELQLLVSNLRKTSPGTAILFTTPPVSYRGKTINPHLARIRNSLLLFCRQNRIACWDLRAVIAPRSGFHRILNRDRIHYTAEGYRLMGNLLWNAIIDGR